MKMMKFRKPTWMKKSRSSSSFVSHNDEDQSSSLSLQLEAEAPAETQVQPTPTTAPIVRQRRRSHKRPGARKQQEEAFLKLMGDMDALAIIQDETNRVKKTQAPMAA